MQRRAHGTCQAAARLRAAALAALAAQLLDAQLRLVQLPRGCHRLPLRRLQHPHELLAARWGRGEAQFRSTRDCLPAAGVRTAPYWRSAGRNHEPGSPAQPLLVQLSQQDLRVSRRLCRLAFCGPAAQAAAPSRRGARPCCRCCGGVAAAGGGSRRCFCLPLRLLELRCQVRSSGLCSQMLLFSLLCTPLRCQQCSGQLIPCSLQRWPEEAGAGAAVGWLGGAAE